LLNTIANYVALVGLAFSLGIQVTTGLIQDVSESESGGFGDLKDLMGANKYSGFGVSHGVNTHTQQTTFDSEGTRRRVPTIYCLTVNG